MEGSKELYEIVQKIDQNPNSDLSKIPDGSADKVIGLLVEDISEVIEESHEKTHKANETVEEAAKLLAQPPRKQRWKLRKNVKSTILASTMIVLNIYFFSALICVIIIKWALIKSIVLNNTSSSMIFIIIVFSFQLGHLSAMPMELPHRIIRWPKEKETYGFYCLTHLRKWKFGVTRLD